MQLEMTKNSKLKEHDNVTGGVCVAEYSFLLATQVAAAAAYLVQNYCGLRLEAMECVH